MMILSEAHWTSRSETLNKIFIIRFIADTVAPGCLMRVQHPTLSTAVLFSGWRSVATLADIDSIRSLAVGLDWPRHESGSARS